THLRKNGLTYARRDDFFGDFYTSDILKLLDEGKEAEALAVTTELLRRYHINIAPETITSDLKEAESFKNISPVLLPLSADKTPAPLDSVSGEMQGSAR